MQRSAVMCLMLAACGAPRAEQDEEAASTVTGVSPSATSAADGGGDTAEGAGDGASSGVPRLDAEEDPSAPECRVQDADDLSGYGACESVAPPDSFDPVVQWAFAEGGFESQTTPLVANLTDDNGDGAIDLCDTPDVVLIAFNPDASALFVLDGETGALHTRVDGPFSPGTPALGDLDGDGVAEIVTMTCVRDTLGRDCEGNVVAYHGDGTLAWEGRGYRKGEHDVALADADNDGDVEILVDRVLYDHTGQVVADFKDVVFEAFFGLYSAPTFVDLDGDGDLEILFGAWAAHHDGSEAWTSVLAGGFPQVANLDDDDEPEVLLTNVQGVSVLEHDGVVKVRDVRPTEDRPDRLNWIRPAVIHDVDGDGEPEVGIASASGFSVLEADLSPSWTAPTMDASGIAGGTAFDFLGDGHAETILADERTMWVFGDAGAVAMQSARTSLTLIEYPVVADVDNDGSAEILVVSNRHNLLQAPDPAVVVLRDAEDRWIQARRIWNQHTYHVTNVREDGTIPRMEAPHWLGLNTFRTNAQIEASTVCRPTPVG